MSTETNLEITTTDAAERASSIAQTGVRPRRTTGPLGGVPPGPAKATKRPRILVVDDDEHVRRLLGAMLSSSGTCQFASCAEEALELMSVERFDIALVDIVMPRHSGVSLLGQIRTTSPSTVVILMTGLQDSRLGVESIRKGAFDFVTKPFDAGELRTAIRRAMHFKEMTEESEFYQEHLEALVVDRTAALQAANEQLEGKLLETKLSYRAILHELTAALEARDIESFGHTERVVAYATRLAVQMDLGHEDLVSVEHGAMLHDIGTIFVAEEVLRKPMRLTDAEWASVRRHPEDGGRMLRRCGMFADAAPIVEQHHERWDGQGYPKGLRGTEIDLRARIFAVADCMDVMLSDRPYSPARTFSEAAEELLRCKGQHFDPAVVDAFFDVPVEEWDRIRSHPHGQDVSVTGRLDAATHEAAHR